MATIKVICPNPACGAAYELDKSYIDRKVQCANCETKFYIERSGEGVVAKFAVVCPTCQADYAVGQQDIGKMRQCATCGNQFRFQPAGPKPNLPPPSQVTQTESAPSDWATEPEVTQQAEPAVHAGEAQTIAATPPEHPEDVRASEADVPAEWKVGDVIIDTYEVKKISENLDYAKGGMGSVYRVHHRGWNIDLAVKSPKPDYFRTEAQKENFTRECETWINLGLHPHIVSCHYVRTLGGIPRVFAEYVEGGSLKDWIDNRKLYEGGPTEALKRILDIAVQFAWGLQYAHEKGLIHQDVKPANVMMTPDGTAKVTDFGLARARAAVGEAVQADKQRSILVSTGGMTPAYCSPEQANKQPLSRRTDIWSWGVSVLEMFVGEVCWQSGVAAPQVLAQLKELRAEGVALPEMPERLRELLQQCFEQNQEQRPKDMAEIVAVLKEIYQQTGGEVYPREELKAAELLADGLNNKALSMLDLGKQEEAEKLFDEALGSDPRHVEATYNRGLLLWRSGRMTDDELVQRLATVHSVHPDDWRTQHHLGMVHLERGDAQLAVEAFAEALRIAPQHHETISLLEAAKSLRRDSGTFVRALEGHSDFVRSVCMSLDGRLALSGGYDNRILLWDLETGECLRSFSGHTHCVESVCLSANGQWALSGSLDKTLRLWDVRTGHCVRILRGHAEGVKAVSLSANARWAVSASDDATVRFWDIETGSCVRTLDDEQGRTVVATLSPDGRLVLTAWYETLKLWDMTLGRRRHTFEGLPVLESICLRADGRYALSGSQDGTLRLWELSTGTCLRTFVGPTDAFTAVALTSDGRWAVSGGADRTVRIWEVATGKCVRTFDGHDDIVFSVSTCMDGRWVISGSGDKTLRLWRIPKASNLRPARIALCLARGYRDRADTESSFRSHLSQATQALGQGRLQEAHDLIQFARSLSGCQRRPEALSAWCGLTLRAKRAGVRGCYLRWVLSGHTIWPASVRVSEDGRFAFSGAGGKDCVRVWDLETGRCVQAFLHDDENSFVSCMQLSHDERWLVAGYRDHSIRIWDLQTGTCVRSFTGSHGEIGPLTGGINSLSLSADGRWALSTAVGGTQLRLWELATGRCVRTLGESREGVRMEYACLSADCRFAVSAGKNGTLRIWDIAASKCVRTIQTGMRENRTICLSRSGRRVLVQGQGKARDDGDSMWMLDSMWLLDLASGESSMELSDAHESHSAKTIRHTPNCSLLDMDERWAFSGGSDIIWAGGEDETVLVWDLCTGGCAARLDHDAEVMSLHVGASGRWLVSGCWDNAVRVWELEWDVQVPEATDWDEGARPLLETFLTLHAPYAASLPRGQMPSEGEISLALTRRGKPVWIDADFNRLLYTLGCAGYGWLRPEGVRNQLEKMAADWQGPPPLPWEK